MAAMKPLLWLGLFLCAVLAPIASATSFMPEPSCYIGQVFTIDYTVDSTGVRQYIIALIGADGCPLNKSDGPFFRSFWTASIDCEQPTQKRHERSILHAHWAFRAAS